MSATPPEPHLHLVPSPPTHPIPRARPTPKAQDSATFNDERGGTIMDDVWTTALDAWAIALRSAGRPETTITLRRYQLSRLARDVEAGPWDLTGDDLITYTGAQTWGRDTRRAFRSAARAFYSWAITTGRTAGPSPADALAPVRAQPPAPHPADDDAVRQALAQAGPRERLAIRLAAEVGLRRGEVVLVHSRDLVRDVLGWSLVVHGKGGRDRLVPLGDGLAVAVREACERGGGFAFPGRIEGHMAASTLGRYIGRLLPEGRSMHSLRHRFATRAYVSTGDLLAVQQLLGHTSPTTTQRYVQVDHARHREVMLAAA